ncbi:MAG: enoyl-CoA hydratase-related protein [Solirubrobacterales bacterium]
MEASSEQNAVERFQLKALVEACLVLEERVAGAKDIDMGMMLGAGILPGPLQRADYAGLDEMVSRLEAAEAEWGENFETPQILTTLVNQGRLGEKSGQGFFPYAQADEGYEQPENVKLETRGNIAIVWLDQPPMNQLSPDTIASLAKVWGDIEQRGDIRAVIFTSSSPAVFCAGADIKAFTQLDESSGAELLEKAHGFMRGMETSSISTIAAVNSLALGGGCELAMGCDFRLAAEGASFGQPEINLGIIPGFGGTQRLARLVGEGKALEMNLVGESISSAQAYDYGLANAVVPDHELFDTALSWARKLAGQAPIAVEQIKTVSAQGDLDEGLKLEAEGFATAFNSEDGKEGIAAFLGKRDPEWKGR